MAASLIDELQLDASNAAGSVSSLLRKALMVASKLQLSDIPEWINKELSGYSNGDSPPPYRILYGTLKARTSLGWIPVQFPTDELQEMVSKRVICNSVAEIEKFSSKGSGKPMMGFSPELQQLLQNTFQKETQFACFLEKARFDAILDEVRNQVLRWAIALDKAGVRGDGLTFTGAEKKKAITIDSRQYVVHGSTNVQIGDGNAQGIDVERIVTAINDSKATVEEKAQAKSILQSILDSPFLSKIFGGFTSSS